METPHLNKARVKIASQDRDDAFRRNATPRFISFNVQGGGAFTHTVTPHVFEFNLFGLLCPTDRNFNPACPHPFPPERAKGFEPLTSYLASRRSTN
jgi:hypothetical protein